MFAGCGAPSIRRFSRPFEDPSAFGIENGTHDFASAPQHDPAIEKAMFLESSAATIGARSFSRGSRVTTKRASSS
jgi:hypothetical protein